ncbi:ABC transporter ATP-binding protein/permease (plasmid) [Clostridium estertheticum]|uniref:ABC transporter ATP-binding protein/permease n=1 Tax=Clostridium estertheticum TaxID=238834 RepID=A0AA47EPY2_9CLOT|nr:ABC transporter ATP-binding protein [Clostridium estertheticum]MBU3157721.1 ABC transporter ATP-binding protein/permease [Clostridium estertheticum]MBU3201974.1 ABC transporter ATP-binding protein/permease [Clostridium estertheticum]WAG63349.1 ABC transporter ATP-binding protein/permease [Clostridium estertheticum]WAG68219.1 ABC transporter ATP-binding protein/permease [Clostridium estertheticum]
MGSYTSLFKLKPYIKKCKFWFLGGILGMILCSAIYMPIPYLMGYIIDNILLKHRSYNELYKLIMILALFYILIYVISIYSKKLFIKIENFVVNDIRMSLMDKIIDLPMSFLSKTEKGYVLSRISECSNIGKLFSPTFISVVLTVFDLIFALIMMFALNFKLTIVALFLIPIYYFTVKSSSKHLTESTKILLETSAILSGETYEVLNGIEEIKILNGKETQLIKFKNKIEAVVKSGIKQSKQFLLFVENIALVNNLATLMILLCSGVLILKGELTIGIYTAFATYMGKVVGSTMAFANLGMTLKPVCVSIERIQEFLDLTDENENRPEIIEDSIQTINIKNLSFKYEANGQNIINKLNFIINKGDKLFLKGENGTGKSTLIKIILGLYDPSEGEIFINDKKYSKLDKKSIRKRIGVVSQSIFLFKGSVLENILYGQVDKSKQDIINLIKEYNLGKYIDSFDKGLETEISQNGTGMSGGQTQIIAFLRATIAKKDIIILDEATSNLDKETREVIHGLLKEKDISNIMIVISHQEEGLEFTNKTLCMNK